MLNMKHMLNQIRIFGMFDIFMPYVVTKNYTWTQLMCTVSLELNDVCIPNIKNIPLRQIDVFSSCWMHFYIFDVLLAVIDLILISVNLILLSIRLPKWCLIFDNLLMLIDYLLYHYICILNYPTGALMLFN